MLAAAVGSVRMDGNGGKVVFSVRLNCENFGDFGE